MHKKCKKISYNSNYSSFNIFLGYHISLAACYKEFVSKYFYSTIHACIFYVQNLA